jgi:F420-dependent oxidoreductase-like protein
VELGLSVGYWSAGPPEGAAELVATADDLVLDSVWTAEAYGSDALTPLAWWGSRTERVRLGTAIMQMSARTPTAAAMAAMTMDHLSGGRFVLGLGASGPQVVEGWYGQPYPKPLARTREYVEVVRQVLAREAPVRHEGSFYPLPLTGGSGLGKPLRSTVHPLRVDLPVFLAAEGPKNVALAAEIADGWFPLWFGPSADAFYRTALADGFGRDGARRTLDDFEVVCPVPVVIDDDVERAADALRPEIALYAGGMGAKGANFHADVFSRMGWEAEVSAIQDAYLAGDREAAIAAVPLAMVEDVALVGSEAKIADELARWEETVLTTMILRPDEATIRTIARLLGRR